MTQVSARADTTASLASTWAVLADQVGMSAWLPVRVTLERTGDLSPDGVGAIRLISRGPVRVREQITALEEPTRLTYRLLSGLPVKDYVGEVVLSQGVACTHIDWTITFRSRVPGLTAVMSRGVRLLVRGLADRADTLST